MAPTPIEYNGVAGVVCRNCDTIVLVIVREARYTAHIGYCPTVTDDGFFCEAKMLPMELPQIDAAMQSYYDLNLAKPDIDLLRATVPNDLEE